MANFSNVLKGIKADVEKATELPAYVSYSEDKHDCIVITNLGMGNFNEPSLSVDRRSVIKNISISFTIKTADYAELLNKVEILRNLFDNRANYSLSTDELIMHSYETSYIDSFQLDARRNIAVIDFIFIT